MAVCGFADWSQRAFGNSWKIDARTQPCLSFGWVAKNLRQVQKSLKNHENKNIVSFAVFCINQTRKTWIHVVHPWHFWRDISWWMASQNEHCLSIAAWQNRRSLRHSRSVAPSPQRFIDGTVGNGHAYKKLQCRKRSPIVWNSGHMAFAKGYASVATSTRNLISK